MHKYFTIIAIVLVAISCKTQQQIANLRPVTGIDMEIMDTDTLAIRALEYREGLYWYAGNKGRYGTVNLDSKKVLRLQLPEEARALEFRSIAVTPDYTYLMSAGSPALLYKVNHKPLHATLVYKDTDERVFFDAMKFWDNDNGIMLGDPIADCFTILKTTDGGKTFKTIPCSAFPDFQEGEAAFAASNSNITLNGDIVRFATGGKKARVFISTDRGKSWSVTSTPIIEGDTMTGIFAMDFYDATTGIVIGGDWNTKKDTSANKAITVNGGASWNLINKNEEPEYCSDILFIPGTQGKELLAVGSQGVWWSGTSGNTWQKITDDGFYTVAMQDANTGVLAGRDRIVGFTLTR